MFLLLRYDRDNKRNRHNKNKRKDNLGEPLAIYIRKKKFFLLRKTRCVQRLLEVVRKYVIFSNDVVIFMIRSLAYTALLSNLATHHALSPNRVAQHFRPLFSSKKGFYFETNSNNIVSFGSRIDLEIPLPVVSDNNTKLARYINDPIRILESTWDKNKITKQGDNAYKLRCREIQLLGMDSISPEIAVDFWSESESCSSVMKSTGWSLNGGSRVLRDADFLKTFDFRIEGRISPTASPTLVRGWVEYHVEGRKPLLFAALPSFILERIVAIIQDRIKQYVEVEFSRRFRSGFLKYGVL